MYDEVIKPNYEVTHLSVNMQLRNQERCFFLFRMYQYVKERLGVLFFFCMLSKDDGAQIIQAYYCPLSDKPVFPMSVLFENSPLSFFPIIYPT